MGSNPASPTQREVFTLQSDSGPRKFTTHLLNIIRGALIGAAELVPGVSGGTVALVTGIYERLLAAISGFFQAIKQLAKSAVKGKIDRDALSQLRKLPWGMLLPLAAGMLATLFLLAAPMEHLLTNYPTIAKALFAGMIVLSIAVPARMVDGRWSLKDLGWVLLGSAAAFILASGGAGTPLDPNPLLIIGSAAIAICALVLPGVSGSYVLLLIGMYVPTLAAVSDRDFGYLGLFMVGAAVGAAVFIPFLEWLLNHRRRPTLLLMTGLLIGSLRALWPWQDADGGLLAPAADWLPVLVSFAIGAALVAALLAIESRAKK